MFKTSLFCLLMLLSPLSLSACNVPQYGVLSAEPLTPDQAIVQSTVGRQIELVLPTPGVGSPYEWSFEPLPENAPVRFVEEKAATSRYPERTPENYAPDRIFVFESVAIGSLKVIFKQRPKAIAEPGVGSVSDIDVQRTFELEVR
jgi:hypothetical protein